MINNLLKEVKQLREDCGPENLFSQDYLRKNLRIAVDAEFEPDENYSLDGYKWDGENDCWVLIS